MRLHSPCLGGSAPGTVAGIGFRPPPPLDNVNGIRDYKGIGTDADGKDYTMTQANNAARYTEEDNYAIRRARNDDICVLAIAAALKTEIPEGALIGMLWGLNLRAFKFEPQHFFNPFVYPDMSGSYLPALSEKFLWRCRPILKHSDAPHGVIIHAAIMSAFDTCDMDILKGYDWAARLY